MDSTDADCSFCKAVEDENGPTTGYEYESPQISFHSACADCIASKNEENDPLCAGCSHMRLRHLFVCRQFDTWLRYLPMGTVQQVYDRSSSCRLCRLVSDTISMHTRIQGLSETELWSLDVRLWFDVRRGYGRQFRVCVSTLITAELAVWIKTNTESCQSKLIGWDISAQKIHPPDLPKFIDWKHLKTELSFSPQERPFSERPRHLWLIDTKRDRVVRSWRRRSYAALSYVWGGNCIKSGPSSFGGFFERDKLPATIRDAMVACAALGERYLWVDQLCINQQKKGRKQQQISQMDRIYHTAKFTLVAMAGENSDHDLPGVTTPRRWNHSRAEIGDLVITNVAPSLTSLCKWSKWASRGWTFQETVFSCPLILFTEYGCYTLGLDAQTLRRRKWSESCQKEDDLSGIPEIGDYWDMLEQYSRRQLSFDTDILNAFTAAIRAAHGDATSYGLPLQYIDKAMLWTPDNDPAIVTSRRDGWPSWSWASHSGPIRHCESKVGLAYWGLPNPKLPSRVEVCKPPASQYLKEGFIYSNDRFDPLLAAWHTGCLKTPPPDQSMGLLDKFEKWHTYPDYWHHAFNGYEDDPTVFSLQDIKTAAPVPGRILVHAQTAHLNLRRPTQSNARADTFWAHVPDGGFAGLVRVPTYLQSTLILDAPNEFLLLSVGSCYGTGMTQAYFDYTGIEHKGQFPDTPDCEQVDELRFKDPNHEIWPRGFNFRPPLAVLNVMLIDRDQKTNIARRLGVGQIFLMRWIQAPREFKTVILE